MEQTNSTISMIHMFPYPVFLVQNGVISHRNQAAMQLNISQGTPIYELLTTGGDIYRQLCSGCLSLTLSIHNTDFLATVIRMDNYDIFHLDTQDGESSKLHALALAASQLRQPLSQVTTSAELLLANSNRSQRELTGHLNKALMQILRMLGNMSDAQDYADRTYRMETVDAAEVIWEALETAQAQLASAGRTLLCKCSHTPMVTWADRSMLERAVYNLISNAAKYSPKESNIRADLEIQSNRLVLRVENACQNITPELLGTIFFRYKRTPMVEPGEHGIGLGIPMIRSVAAAHAGTLLVDQPESETLRFTLTIAKRSPAHPVVSQPRIFVDDTGGKDVCLMELSDVLSAAEYED